jgi:hypothetical protein
MRSAAIRKNPPGDAIDNKCSCDRLREFMPQPPELKPEELTRIAADPNAALLASTGSAGAGPAIRNPRENDRSPPKKRRKKRAASKQMIAVTGKARWGNVK